MVHQLHLNNTHDRLLSMFKYITTAYRVVQPIKNCNSHNMYMSKQLFLLKLFPKVVF